MPQVPTWIVVLQGLLTPVIATVVAYIAYQQYQINRRKLVLDLYDRRVKVYQSTIEFITSVCREGKPRLPDYGDLHQGTAEAVFLFGPEIPQYLKRLREQAGELFAAAAEYRDVTQEPPPGYD